MGPTVLFTHLKIILLQYFQFSVSATISSIQTDPLSPKNKKITNLEKKLFQPFLYMYFFIECEF